VQVLNNDGGSTKMTRRFFAIAGMVAMFSMILAPVAVAQPTTDGFVRDITDQIIDPEGDEELLLQITEVTRDGDQLLFSGTITGTDGEGEINDTFTNVPGDLNGDGDQARCDILFLDLTGVELDLLGLNVNLDLVLDVFAEPGPGNLLGNLLCAVAGLLDGPGLLGNIGNTVDRLLGRINDLL
jgi:hypothetical protein